VLFRSVIADGSGTANLLNPGSIPAAVRVVDIVACDENRDSDVDPAVCAFAWEEPVQRQPLPGAPAILDDGTTIFYEFGLDFSAAPEDRDVIALGPNGVVWETALPGDLDWNSVVTVTDNHIIGTASKVTLSDQQLLGLTFPSFTDDRLVVLDRRDGSLVFEAPIPDDSAATVTVGPDGSLYVGVLGLLSILSIEEEPNLGLVRFAPRLRNQRE
jgi:outer membrane protein assembly factor BamB